MKNLRIISVGISLLLGLMGSLLFLAIVAYDMDIQSNLRVFLDSLFGADVDAMNSAEENNALMMGHVVTNSIYYSLGLISVAAGFAVLSAFNGFLINPKGGLKILGGIVGLGGILVGSLIKEGATFEWWFQADATTSLMAVHASTDQWVSTGIYTFYILFGLTLLAVLTSTLSRMISNLRILS